MVKQTIVVTGATGFLGSHILDALVSQNESNVIAACRDPSRLIPGFQGDVKVGNLHDRDYLNEITKNVDIVCHAAAWTSMWAHREQEQRLYRSPTIQLIDTALASGVKRFIFPSSPVVTHPHRNRSEVKDQESPRHPGFWPHLDIVVDIEQHLQRRANKGMDIIILRLGHFAGQRYNLGFLSLLLPRLKTHLVPWVARGTARVPLTDGRDLANGFVLAAHAKGLQPLELFNICGPEFPSMHEVLSFLNAEVGTPKPHFSVPLSIAYAFAWFMEKINSAVPGDPFLTRSIVLLGEDWYAPSDRAEQLLGYTPKHHWKEALRVQLNDMANNQYSKTALVDSI